MATSDDGSQQQFKRELSQLIHKYASGLPTGEVSELLGEFHHDLAQGPLRPTCEVQGDAEPFTVRVRYATALGLEQDLDGFLQVGGVCLDLDRALPPLAEVIIKIGADSIEQSVTLRGRAVQETAQGVAFQLTPPEGAVADNLAAMPDLMRAAAADARKLPAQQQPAQQQPAQQQPAQQQPAQATQSRPVPGPPTAARPSAPAPTVMAEPIAFSAEPAQTWTLSQTSAPDILRELLTNEGFAVLDVEMGQRRAQIVLEGNQVVDVEIYPRAERESLASLLQAAGQIDAEDIRRAREHIERHGVSMAEALVDLDVLGYSQMGVALKTRARFLLGMFWGREQGQAALYRLDGLDRRYRTPRSPLSYHLFRRLRDGFEKAGMQWVAERKDFFRGHMVKRRDSPGVDVAELELRPKEARLYDAVLDTERPLSEVLRISHLGEQETVVLLECLHQLGLLELQEVNPWTRRRTNFIKQLERMKARMSANDHFEVLGLHWTAYEEEIENAYEERLEGLSDEKLPDNLDDATLEMVAQLRESLHESYELLSDRRRRRSYRDEIVDDFEKKSALEMFIKQADTAKLRRDLPAAIDAYQRVLEVQPGHRQAKQDLEVLRKLRAAEKGMIDED